MLIGCDTPAPADHVQEEVYDSTKRKDVINEIMSDQEEAWNNGNLEGFMQAYLKSDSLIFIGSRGAQYGWSTTLMNYKKSYPDREAMGMLQFDNTEFKDLPPHHSFVIGRWTLFRKADTLQGSYSLLWEWVNAKPVIIADHSS